MGKILRVIFSGIGITFMVAIVFSLAMWFLGGFLGFGDTRPFDSLTGRLVGVAIIWVAALLTVLLILLRREKRDKALADDVAEAPEVAVSTDDSIVASEVGEMRKKLKEALTLLRKSKSGRRSLYELPWYLIIGPPGAGKTTALMNSGLKFPLAETMGSGAIGGVGGTRNCDWWLTDQAVLVDTAGRYTTQESDREADNAAWLSFLNILKRHRTRQPINGALVAISLADLSLQDEVTQEAHARAIRKRLNELRERLGVHFPVYVLFTKSDLIAGFTEFYDHLGKDARGQVWGVTFPLPKVGDERATVERFDDEFALLLERLNALSLERMQAETDPQRRALIAGFPLQFASTRKVAKSFLNGIFEETRFDQRQMLRGVYFTSGTQEGAPIDRLLMGMAQTFGIGRQAIARGQGTGRSYFLTRLFEDVMFPESGLVSADDKVERRFRWTRRAAIAATILAVAGTGALWTRSYTGNEALSAAVAEDIALYREAEARIPDGPVADTDLPLIVPALNALRDIPVIPANADTEVPDGLGWGLYQGDVMGSSAAQAYRASLNRHFLPRLLLRLEEQMQANIDNPDLLYEALRVYLMLGLSGPMNRDLVTEWMTVDWALTYPGPSRAPMREDLATHLEALLSQPMQAVPLNNDLTSLAQEVIAKLPPAQRVYNGIVNGAAAAALPPWRLTDHGGPSISRVMTRSSGEPLNEGIEGIYTYDGFHEVFLPAALSVAERIESDAWVLGEYGALEATPATLAAISRDVLDIYYDDFVSRWDRLLEDIDIVPLESLSHAVEVTNVLSGPTSPITNILTTVADETQLATERDTAAVAEGAASGATQVGELTANRLLGQRTRILLNSMRASAEQAGQDYVEPGTYVQNRFDWLHQFVARPDGQVSQLDLMMDSLRLVYEDLNKLNFQGGIGSPQDQSTALIAFRDAASRVPGPLERWATQIAVGSSGIAAGGTRAAINAQWQTNVLPFCTQVTSDSYPFNRRSRADTSLQDFTRLFSPGGLIDKFFQENLATLVDMRSRPWTWKPNNNADLGISQAVLTQMQHAAEIRDAFFGGGGPQLSVSFTITPNALDPKAVAVLLEIDGQQVAFSQGGQAQPTAITWPGPVGLARIGYAPQNDVSESTLQREGPWALFRLLNAAEIRATNVSDRKRVVFNVGGRIAIFVIQSSNVHDALSLPALSKFSCPSSF